MRNVKSVILSLSLGLFVLFGCTSDNPTGASVPSGVIMPLAIGNQWIQRYVLYSDTQHETRDTIKVLSDTLINNQRWYLVSDGPYGVLMANQSDGLWIRSGGISWLVWKYPANPGDVYHRPADSVRVASTSRTITVTAGTYRCYEYRINHNPPIFIAPNVGMVRLDSVVITGDDPTPLGLGRIELVSAILH